MTPVLALLDRPLRAARMSVLSASRASGITGWWLNSSWRRERLAILCYHGISKADEHEWRPSLYIAQDRLADRLRMLREMGCAVLPLGAAVRHLRGGTLPPKAVALTFDDGAHDFLTHALPILEEYEMPSTVYVTTYYSDHPTWPVFTVGLSYILWRSRRSTVAREKFDTLCGKETHDRRWDFEQLTRQLVNRSQTEDWSGADKNEFLRQLSAVVGFDFDSMVSKRQLCLMSQDEMTSLPQSVDLQLHTHTHITPTSAEILGREIDRNRQRLEATGRTQQEPHIHFCYPSGIVHDQLPGWLARAGVETATTCDVRLASASDDPLLLPRIVDTTPMSAVEFQSWVAGPREFLRR